MAITKYAPPQFTQAATRSNSLDSPRQPATSWSHESVFLYHYWLLFVAFVEDGAGDNTSGKKDDNVSNIFLSLLCEK